MSQESALVFFVKHPLQKQTVNRRKVMKCLFVLLSVCVHLCASVITPTEGDR